MHHRRRALTNLRSFLVALSLVLGGVLGVGVHPARAAAGNILPPFDVGETWNICRGYGYASHTGTSTFGLDLTGAGCDNSATGRTVRAPMDGTVSYFQAAYGNLCVNAAGGRSFTLTHINSSLTPGTTVSAGQSVGSVSAAAPPGVPPDNGGVAHIHFQLWGAPNCYNGSGIPFDAAHNARICGAPDLTAGGPSAGNGTWSGTPITGAACDSTPPQNPGQPPQFIVQRQGANVYAKAGFAEAWSHLAGNTVDVQVAETRIVTRDPAHTIYAKEGIGGSWFTLADNVDEYAVSANLVVIRQGTKVSAKADLWGPWVQIANDAIDVQVAGTRIGHRDTAHELYLNDGLYGSWYHVASNVDEFRLAPGLVVQRQGANVYAKAGFADAWSHLAENAIDLQVAGNRIGNRDAAHRLYVKDGIGGTWYAVADNVDEFGLTPDLIVQRRGAALFGKSTPTSAWVQIANDAIDVQVAGTRIGHRNGSHELYLNDGLYGPWYDVASNVDEYDLS
ncbi:peptidoglycan DD-metalloendopeptidase family protein [Streptomyces sp. BE303]|uniref:peptidoglycan DD-metalloendopeptidase family protein n=1 Tax=Streptomyces sp. BE303 TaxID=3002528 RepID=UPI002E79A08C|nr:peptidoglycan DD-metalloendopeptidase family protein [Streptomyces sp. BE303]MED7949718.1 peptidoglycan DD-metalloendopeptidase family protein [Streptomyces sp. BE303]